MKKLLTIFLLNALIMSAFAQKQAVLDAFSKHDIDLSVLDPKNKQTAEDYAFDLKYTSVAANKETVTLAQYDPSKAEADRWTVISVKGKAPSASEIKTFKKNHSRQPVTGKIDEATFLVEKETPDYLVISYKQDPASMPQEAQFMKDCRLHMTINLKTKKVEKIQSLNEKPLKIKIFNAEKLDLVVKFNWNEQEKRYFTESEDLNLIVKFLGQLAPMETLSEYSNYRKVK
ncbi:hypothetical protein [Pedobacter nyackensis]|uniref:hypothetical protein n=1 Tax=Pedobacter nyackensis TaxID=475255 RepID=UPI0029313385|nr:hypothetical protein [Pedobacter nyackensis]